MTNPDFKITEEIKRKLSLSYFGFLTLEVGNSWFLPPSPTGNLVTNTFRFLFLFNEN